MHCIPSVFYMLEQTALYKPQWTAKESLEKFQCLKETELVSYSLEMLLHALFVIILDTEGVLLLDKFNQEKIQEHWLEFVDKVFVYGYQEKPG